MGRDNLSAKSHDTKNPRKLGFVSLSVARARPIGRTLNLNKRRVLLTAIVTSIRNTIHNFYMTEMPKFIFRKKEIQILTRFGDLTALQQGICCMLLFVTWMEH